jgi:membrane protease YdiL (CAAX protease family)
LDLNHFNPLKQHPLVSFFVLAYGIAWIPLALQPMSGDVVLSFAFWAPAVSALILVAVNGGKSGTQKLVSKLFLWRAGVKWYVIALLSPVVLELLAFATHMLLGRTPVAIDLAAWVEMLPSQLLPLILVLSFLVLLSTGEELGWRGYALPELQARYGSVRASLVLGLLWGLWHLPVFWIPGTVQYGLPVPGYIIATVGYSFIYTCVLNGAKGSVLLASLYHAASNLVLTYGNAIAPTIIHDLYLSLPALALVVMAVVFLSGPGVLVGRQS